MFDKRLLALVPVGTRFAFASVALRVGALVAQVVALLTIASLLDSVVAGMRPDWVSSALTIAVALVAMLVMLSFSRWFEGRAASQLQVTVCSEVFGKLARLGVDHERALSDARAVSLMGEGVELLKPYLSRYLPQFVYALAAPLLLFAVVAAKSALAAAVMLLCVFLMPVTIMLLMRRAKGFMGEHWGTYVDLGASFLDAVRGLVTLRVFGSDADEQRKLDEEAEGFRQVTLRLLKAQLGSVALMDLFTYGGIAVGTVAVAIQLAIGGLSVGDALAVLLLASGFFTPMRAFGSQFHTGMNAAPVLEELFCLLDAPEPEYGDIELDAEQASILVRNMGYSYGAEREDAALEGVDLEIWPNSFTGIVGKSGSGKSTLARLLAGELRGYEGSITCNGIELSQLSPRSLNRLVTVVSRQSHVFKGSFRTNLLIAAPKASDAALWEALRQAHLDEYVLSCGGLDAMVDAQGASLSGGQCQRLCFARALLRNTPIYIFDEATSNVDAQSEQLLMAAIQKLALSKTVVIATHRLSQLRFADEILVLDEGRVAERGTHGELLSHGGIYRSMWDSNAELERFAAEVEEGLPPEKPSALQEALGKMPGMMSGIMGAFVSIMQAERYGSAGTGAAPSGHPAWIPLPDYEQGMSERPEDAAAAAGGGVEDAPCAPTGMKGFVDATLGDLSDDETAEIRAAMGTVRDCLAKPVQAQVRVVAQPPVSRSAFAIAAKLMGLTRDMLGELALASALGLLSQLAAVGVAVFGALALLAAVGMGADSLNLQAALLAAAACALVRGPLHYAERLLTHDQTFKTLARIRSAVFAKLRTLPLGKLAARDAGDKVSLLTSGVELLEGFYSRVCSPLLAALLLAVLVLVALLFIHPALALVALASYALVAVAIPVLGERMTRKRGAELHAYSVLMTGFLIDSLEGMSELVRFGRASEFGDELIGHMESLGAGSDSFSKRTALFSSLAHACSLVCIAGFVLVAAALVLGGVVATPVAVACCLGFTASMSPMVDIAGLGFSLHQTLAAADRVLDVLEDPSCDTREGEVELAGFGGMSVRDVSFGYDGVQVLDDISFEIEAGEFVGISGKSGAGKSTLLQLMMRFADPDAGEVSVDGVLLPQVSAESLRAVIGYMPQETYLFDGDLRRNLLVARPQATDAELEAAIETAALAPLVARLPQGLETPVAGEGGGLSDGERQRLGLARVFLSGAPLLLLDEPTSNLDALNEAAILRALCTGAGERTIVIVSHRKAVAAIVDKLLVVETDRES